MTPHNQASWHYYDFAAAALILLAVFAIRITYLHLTPYELYFDEAQYWSWSKALDWGYATKPPMLAWLIAGMTEVCGNTPTCIRITAPILHLLTACVIYFIGLLLYDARVGFWSSITYATLPAVMGFSYFFTADSPLLFCWALALYAFIRAYRNDRLGWWLLCAAAAGFGLLSKYNMILFLPSVMLFLLWTKTAKTFLKNHKFWLAILLSFSISLPNLIWNYSHNFISFNNLHDEIFFSTITYKAKETYGYLYGQLGLLGPILFLIVLFAAFKRLRKGTTEHDKLLLSFIFPLFVLVLGLSFIAEAKARWISPAYICAIIFAVVYLVKNNHLGWLLSAIVVNFIFGVIFFHHPILSDKLRIAGHRFYHMTRYNEIIEPVAKLAQKYPDAIILGDRRKPLAVLTYALRTNDDLPKKAIHWNQDGVIEDPFELTGRLEDYINTGTDFIFVTIGDSVLQYKPYFTHTGEITQIRLSVGHLQIMHAHNFEGY